jgi:UDP-glucose-4-epimerase GalE
MSILVTGGAGYIGSITVDLLVRAGEQVVVLDNLSRGHRDAVPAGVPFYRGDVGDSALVSSILREHAVESCVHFAAFAYVGESVSAPSAYFSNNAAQGIGLLDALRAGGVSRIVFSSTCSTYGEPRRVPITEDDPQWPSNPYGWSKLFFERTLDAYAKAYGLAFVALRYFNAAGACHGLGERHEPETHLVPNVLAAALGTLPRVEVYGSDYPTPDGTAIRDYVHVEDLAAAHLLALRHLRHGGASEFVNLGNGHGYSVLEVIDAARRVTGRSVEYAFMPRRAGDPPHLLASSEKARQLLGWLPQHEEIEAIISSAWEWHVALDERRQAGSLAPN